MTNDERRVMSPGAEQDRIDDHLSREISRGLEEVGQAGVIQGQQGQAQIHQHHKVQEAEKQQAVVGGSFAVISRMDPRR
jgi:hypothetical protein